MKKPFSDLLFVNNLCMHKNKFMVRALLGNREKYNYCYYYPELTLILATIVDIFNNNNSSLIY
jgi:hypothetical protein